MFLSYFVGLLIVLIALATVVTMFWAVLREPHRHEQHYIPPKPLPVPPSDPSVDQPSTHE